MEKITVSDKLSINMKQNQAFRKFSANEVILWDILRLLRKETIYVANKIPKQAGYVGLIGFSSFHQEIVEEIAELMLILLFNTSCNEISFHKYSLKEEILKNQNDLDPQPWKVKWAIFGITFAEREHLNKCSVWLVLTERFVSANATYIFYISISQNKYYLHSCDRPLIKQNWPGWLGVCVKHRKWGDPFQQQHGTSATITRQI